MDYVFYLHQTGVTVPSGWPNATPLESTSLESTSLESTSSSFVGLLLPPCEAGVRRCRLLEFEGLVADLGCRSGLQIWVAIRQLRPASRASYTTPTRPIGGVHDLKL